MTLVTPLTIFERHLAACEWPAADQALARSAADIAVDAYRSVRRDNGTPYLRHPIGVVGIVRQESGVTAPELLITALLHDVLEVSPRAEDVVRARLGAGLAVKLRALTPDHRLEGRHREARDRTAYRDKLSILPADLVTVRLADRLHNLRDLPHSAPTRRAPFLADLTEFTIPLAQRRASEAQAIELLGHAIVAELDRYLASTRGV